MVLDAGAVIGNGDAQGPALVPPPAGDSDLDALVGVGAGITLVEGVAGVAEHVEQHLLHLLRVAEGERQGLGIVFDQGDAVQLALVGDQLEAVADERRDVHRFRRGLPLAREIEQIAGDAGDALSFLDDGAQEVGVGLGLAGIEQDLGVVDDAVDRVVDLVGHAGGQLSHRGELGGAEGLGLAQLLLGQVAGEQQGRPGLALVLAQGADVEQVVAAQAAQFGLEVAAGALPEQGLERTDGPGRAAAVEDLAHPAADDLLPRAAGLGHGGRVNVEDNALGADDQGRVEHRGEDVLPLVQGMVEGLVLGDPAGDVDAEQHQPDPSLVDVRADGAVPVDGAPLVRAGLQLGLEIHLRVAVAEQPGKLVLAGGAVLRGDEHVHPVAVAHLMFPIAGNLLGRGIKGKNLTAGGEGDEQGLHGLHDLAVEIVLEAQVGGGVPQVQGPSDGGGHVGDEVEIGGIGKGAGAAGLHGQHPVLLPVVDQGPGDARTAAAGRGDAPQGHRVGLVGEVVADHVPVRGQGPGRRADTFGLERQLVHEQLALLRRGRILDGDVQRGDGPVLFLAAHPGQAAFRVPEQDGAAAGQVRRLVRFGLDLQLADLPQQLVALDKERDVFSPLVHGTFPGG